VTISYFEDGERNKFEVAKYERQNTSSPVVAEKEPIVRHCPE